MPQVIVNLNIINESDEYCPNCASNILLMETVAEVLLLLRAFSSETEATLKILRKQGVRIMATVNELLVELAEANVTTNEIAADVDVLLSKLADGGLSAAETEQVRTEIVALKSRLQGVAAKYTPDVVPPVDPTL